MPNLEGKRVLITGASRGIGRSAAHMLAEDRPHLVLVVRDRALGEAVKETCLGRGAASCELLVGDLSSMKAVRQIAAEYNERWQDLHVLIDNAGALYTDRRTTEDGLEMTFAVNHLAYFLLTTLLLDVLRASAPARIVVVASRAHGRGEIRWDDLQSERGYWAPRVYGTSKLMNILFTRELARRLEGTGVTANSLHPGVIGSSFGHNNGGLIGALWKLGKPFLMNEDDGARTTVFLARHPSVEGVTGKYFDRCKEATPKRAARDDDAARRLWSVSEEIVARLGGSRAERVRART